MEKKTAKKPSGTKLTKIRNLKGKKAFVTWKRNSKVVGYKVQFCRYRSFPKKHIKEKVIRRNSLTSYKRKLSRGKWYVRIQCYKGMLGKYVYSNWSAVKAIKIKK